LGSSSQRWRDGYFSGNVYVAGNTVWHAGNDGSGSGLDADLLDGLHLSDLDARYINASGDTISGTLVSTASTVLQVNNQAIFQAKNSAGTYETFLWPRWSDNIMYLNYGSGGFNIRNNSSVSTVFMTNDNKVGIGTTSPVSKLEISGGSLRLPSSGYEGAGQIQCAGIVRFANGSAAQEVYVKQISVTDSWADADINKLTNGIYTKGGIRTAGQIISTVATGTPPLSVSSTTLVTNLNADMVDGIDSSRIVYGTNEAKSGRYSSTSIDTDAIPSGFYDLNSVTTVPTSESWHYLIHVRHGNLNGYALQIVAPFFSDGLYFRRISGGTVNPWQKIWHSGNDGAGSGLDADLIDGAHLDDVLCQVWMDL
jgi:hypothetical protein